jgi:hypothetical protein
MTRNGKIARAARPIREQINRRLQNGDTGKDIAESLNAIPEVGAAFTIRLPLDKTLPAAEETPL